MVTTTNLIKLISILLSLIYYFYGIYALIQTSNYWVTKRCPSSNLWTYGVVVLVYYISHQIQSVLFDPPHDQKWLPILRKLVYTTIMLVGIMCWGWIEVSYPCLDEEIRQTMLYQWCYFTMVWSMVSSILIVFTTYLVYNLFTTSLIVSDEPIPIHRIS